MSLTDSSWSITLTWLWRCHASPACNHAVRLRAFDPDISICIAGNESLDNSEAVVLKGALMQVTGFFAPNFGKQQSCLKLTMQF